MYGRLKNRDDPTHRIQFKTNRNNHLDAEFEFPHTEVRIYDLHRMDGLVHREEYRYLNKYETRVETPLVEYMAKTPEEKIDREEAGIGMTKRVIIEIVTDLDPTCKHHTSQMTNSKELKKNRRRPMERNICDQKEARAT
ncbi:hypothetical protein BpHYR1_028019 [Brachionus plicatilis]|uniref:Uncharacterized protein n=1 Tax=Brachionus plicatilis TaxID=10195 RepID=A0A3M7R2U1_BRAPC|nr:hypothetical protein BpHYR1_028019 [Brachionus plicatilis]